MIETYRKLICNAGEMVGDSVALMTEERAVMPCGCCMVVGRMRGEAAVGAWACSDEHDAPMQMAMAQFRGPLSDEGGTGSDLPAVQVADLCLEYAFGRAGLPT